MNNPTQLKGWRLDGGDPCEESWTGVSCSGSSVIYLKLQGLNLSGYLSDNLSDLHHLKHLDVSSNNILGEIPNALPLNATHINLACNYLSQNIPHHLSIMKYLRHLNLSHNALSGPIGNVFTGLENLKEMDLSYNNFTGDLPSSFASLINVTRLFLQNNNFTGSVIYLANLPLTDLDIKENHFSGVIPRQFESIPNLWIGGNKFHAGGNYPPWDFPLGTMPTEQNITGPPRTKSNAIEHYPSHKVGGHKKKSLGPGGIACMVGGVTLVATCAALFIAVRIYRSRIRKLNSLESSKSTLHSLPISTAREYSSTAPEESPQFLAVNSFPILGSRGIPPIRRIRAEKPSRRKSFSKKFKLPSSAKLYTVAELQLATNSFSEENLLGEGSLGSVYKAEFPHGQMLAVKNINMVSLSFHEEEQFLDVISTASKLRHPNIVPLLGYCVEHGQHLLVYEYIRNLSLCDVLHSETYKPLSWDIRLRIALGIARGLDYMHSKVSPPVIHGNIKATNILLDDELMPRICDCGLAILRPLTSNSVKLKASEIAIDETGYISPEHGQPGRDNTKSDIYAFGVLLLELFTGRRPFDSSKPREEQSLVKWASSRLHDGESLRQMVVPGIKRTFSSKALSQFADCVSLCIQPGKEFRPPMSEIVESLTCLLQKSGMEKNDAVDGTEVDPMERSFRSTRTRFIGSPTMSYVSV
ncbi:Pkinase_Tyr domain-containing protein/LRR_6 domain-containing protein/LRR_8 domain-containing protein [Cephalotus follicularis]|uniref:Pkinase_Tyr domain-containing protein/LRR_6 domain-containing protein/LRR_8 domain-containing protein n=1 Tax=Cephalotus follicularis TaxID=3775 RepID=A0A1Q3B7R5_CEPFO|nr:Pkinase_Tyr domain-containing protein/LRR_6 domain-containing protein/LRR_8 domain-containing protein [Cephalotus follicularis]